jgi:2',3'-cyclic-nucleotide 2'-phosphodiesterase (5'-nucleotidase family)
VRQGPGGDCNFTTGTPVGLTAADHYTLTINDFMLAGGDGYPDVRGPGAATQDLLDQDVADYLATLPGNQVTPAIQGRVHCVDPHPGVGVDCTTGSP